MTESMARFIGLQTGSCPLDLLEYLEIDCGELCGTEGRSTEDDCYQCWLDFFIAKEKQENEDE